MKRKSAYKMPVANITDQQHTLKFIRKHKWIELTASNHWFTALIPGFTPPVIVVGMMEVAQCLQQISICKMYDKVMEGH